MIGIRADANSIIASGHLMRCITIARAIVKLGQKVTFFIADEESHRLLNQNLQDDEFEVVVLGSDWRNLESEVPGLIKEIQKRDIKVLLVDSYKVTTDYFAKVKEVCKVAYLDDLLERSYPVDMVINYGGYSEKMGYREAYKDTSAKLLLGLKYAPLREQFYSPDPGEAPDSSGTGDGINVLISTGGADMCNMLLPLVTRLAEEISEAAGSLQVVIGDYVSDSDKIEDVISKYKNVRSHRSVKNMAALMRTCDIAVVAAGTMLTECAACGLPTVFYQVADNQKYNVEFWGNTDGMIFAGDVSQNADKPASDVIDIIGNEVKRLVEQPQTRQKMSNSLLDITDGRGAVLIARALEEMVCN